MQALPYRSDVMPSGSTNGVAVPLDRFAGCSEAATSGCGTIAQAPAGEAEHAIRIGSAAGARNERASMYARAWELLHPQDTMPGADEGFHAIVRRYHRQAIREHLRLHPQSPFTAELRALRT